MIPPEISKIENEVGNYTHNIVFKEVYEYCYMTVHNNIIVNNNNKSILSQIFSLF
jgi:hypothetical protein